MQQLVDYMRKHGGKVYRHPGGFWGHQQWSAHDRLWFGTSSVDALVSRGVATYTEWKEGRRGNGRFPIEATLSKAEARP